MWYVYNINCMHYNWNNCPIAWHGHFGDKNDNQNIIFEAFTNQSLQIWHFFMCS